jgi:hypothetical protein
MGDAAGEVASLQDVDLGRGVNGDTYGLTVVQLAAGTHHTCALLDDAHLCAPRPLPLPWVVCVSLA